MKKILTNILYVSILITLLLHHQTHAVKNQSGDKMNNNISNITVKDIDGKEVNLSDYNGKVLLIVNVASYCGFTRQYSGLEEIYKKYKDKGFEILAFPCNQFKNQEPGTNEEIKNFCSSKFNVTFKLFDKIDVNGKDQSPLYSVLTNNKVTGSAEINWNFEKFLIDKNGNVVSRYLSKVEPESEELTTAIESELQK
ncbi:MAG: glutathione peroxidase [Ignavibacteriaceae bacterium]|jgi:glutathione peroxidase|nr:glutathione peroxidase [Ignavibacteriaceae bacterium]